MSRTSKEGNYHLPAATTRGTIQKSKIKSFISLYECIKNRLGTYGVADIACGLGQTTVYRMKDASFLTADSARKILDTYNSLSVNKELVK